MGILSLLQVDSSKFITLGQAFAHCASTGSYWGWLIGILVVFPTIYYFVQKFGNKTNTDVSKVKLLIAIVFVFFIAAAIFMRPVQVQANTKVYQAAKGHYLGY